jgi:hypothetical protein
MPIVEPEVSPFLATVCREGRAKDSSDLATRDLCAHTCKYGHCKPPFPQSCHCFLC